MGAAANAFWILPASAALLRSSGDSPRGLDPSRASGDALRRARVAASGLSPAPPLRSWGSANDPVCRWSVAARAKLSCSDAAAVLGGAMSLEAAREERSPRRCPGDAVNDAF